MVRQKFFPSQTAVWEVALYRGQKLLTSAVLPSRPIDDYIIGLCDRLGATEVLYYHYGELYKKQLNYNKK